MFILALLALACGCVTPGRQPTLPEVPGPEADAELRERALKTLAESFPPPGSQIVHRAIITVRDRQYVCDGFLEIAPDGAVHLAVVSALGLVTELNVESSGRVELLKVTPLMDADWSREFVAGNLRRMTLPPAGPFRVYPGVDGDILVEQTKSDAQTGLRVRYRLSADGGSWRGLSVLGNDREIYRLTVAQPRSFPGIGAPMPTLFEAQTDRYQVQVRVLSVQPILGDAEGNPNGLNSR